VDTKPESERVLPVFTGSQIHGVAFTPEGRYLATANPDGTVYVLKLAEPGEVFTFTGAERKAAQWALEVGGAVALECEGKTLMPAAVKDLPTVSFQLTQVTVEGCDQVTDAGLKHMAWLSGLKVLNLQGTKVTDAGLKYLAALNGLETLNLGKTEVSPQGVAQLQKALPKCKVQTD
jgi:hypothetical protein